jgi:hypothetical protein
MTRPAVPRQRHRGTIDTLPSGGPAGARVCRRGALTKRRHDLTEVVPPGSNAAREAEKVRTRLLNQVDERRNPRTRATLNQLLDRWLGVLESSPPSKARPPRRPPAPRAAKDAAVDWWKTQQAAGKLPAGAELAKVAGVDPSAGRRWRREWLTAEGQ